MSHEGGRRLVIGVTLLVATAVWAGSVRAQVCPAAPSGLAGSAAAGPAVDLSWVDNAAGEAGYQVERRLAGTADFSPLGTAGADGVSYHDASGLTAGTAYFYRVRATGACPSGWSNVASVIVPATGTTFCRTRLTTHKNAENAYVEHGAGFFGAVWREQEGETSTLVYARLDATGQIMSGPVAVTSQAGYAAGGQLVWDGSSWGLLFYQWLGDVWGLFFERLDGDGHQLGGASKINEATRPAVPSNTRTRGLAWNGGGWGVTWLDGAGALPAVYFAGLGPTGEVVAHEAPVSDSPASASDPVLAFNGSDYGLVWLDGRVAPQQLFFRRLSLDGTPAGPSVQVTSAGSPIWFSDLAWDGANFGLAWTDQRDGDYAPYLRRLDANGAPLSGETRLADPASEESAAFAYDLVLRWLGDRWVLASDGGDETTPNVEIFLTYADASGAWTGPTVLVSTPQDDYGSDFPALAWGSGTLLALWHDSITPNARDMVAQAMDSNGAPGANPRRELTTGHTPGLGAIYQANMAFTGSGLALTWFDARAGMSGMNPVLMLTDASGLPSTPEIWVADPGAPKSTMPGGPAIAFSGEVIGVLWIANDGHLYLSRFSAAGAKQGTDLLLATTALAGNGFYSLAWTGEVFLAAWPDSRDGGWEIYTAAIAPDGTVLAPANRVSNAAGRSWQPALAGDGRARAVVWADQRDGNPEIYAAALDSWGARLGGEVRVTNNTASQSRPHLAWNGDELYAVWADSRDGANRVYGQRLAADATPLGSAVALSPPQASWPRCAWGGGEWGVAFQGPGGAWFAVVDAAGSPVGTARLAVAWAGLPALVRADQHFVLSSTVSAYWDGEVEITSLDCALDATPPTCPTGLTASMSGGDAHLAWTPGSDADFAVAWQCVVRDGARVAVVGPGVGTFIDPMVTPETHAYAVTTLNQGGLESAGCAAASTAGITVTPTSGLVTTEAGGTATFTVVLISQPSANVSIGLSSSDTSEGTVGPATLTFNAGNWNAPQTVTVTGVDDPVVDGAVAYTVVTAPATSSDPDYAGRDGADVAVSNQDDDPKAPAGLQAAATPGPAVVLLWADTTGDETGFEIERREAGTAGFSFLASAWPGTTFYLDSAGLASGKAYFYRIRAEGSGWESAWSNVASVVVPAASSAFCLTRLTTHKNAMNPYLAHGDGFFGAVWRDVDGPNAALVYAKLDATGQILAGPVAVTPWVGQTAGGQLVWAGSEWGLLWYEWLGDAWGLFFERLDADGNVLAGATRVNGASRPVLPANTCVRGLVRDGGGWGVAWSDGTAANEVVRFAHVTAAGVVDVPETVISDSPAAAVNPVMSFDGNSFGIVWFDHRVDPGQLFFRRVTPAGTPVGAAVQVTSSMVWWSFEDLVWNGAEYGLVWDDQRDGDGAAYFRRLDAAGNPLGAETRVSDPITDETWADAWDLTLRWAGDRWVVASDGDDENTTTAGQIFLTFVDATGAKLGSDVVASVNAGEEGADYPALAWGEGTLLAMWHTWMVAGGQEIRAQALDVVGSAGSNPMRALTSGHTPATGPINRGNLAPLGSGLAIAWFDGRDAQISPYLMIVDASGSPVTGVIPVADGSPVSAAHHRGPAIAFSGEVVGVLWTATSGSLYLSRFSPAGAKVGPDLLLATSAHSFQGSRSLAWTGEAFLAAWSDRRNGGWEIYTAAIAADGSVLAAANRISNAGGRSWQPSLAGDGRARAVVWADERDGNSEIYGAALDPLGARLGAEQRLTTQPALQDWPSLGWNGAGFLVAWHDARSYPNQVYAKRLPIDAPMGAELQVSIAGGGAPVVAWGQDRWGVTFANGRGSNLAELDGSGGAIGGEHVVLPGGSTGSIAWDGQRFLLSATAGVYWDGELMITTSECALDATPPTCPTGLVATMNDGDTHLSWAPGSDADFALAWQCIVRDGQRVAIVEPATTGYTDQRPPVGDHTYSVLSLNQGGLESPGCVQQDAYAPATGDTNGDTATNVGDVFYLINNLFAGGPPPLGPGDVNGDDATNVLDVFYLINNLFAGGPPPQ